MYELVDLSGFPDPDKLPVNLRSKSFNLGAYYQPDKIVGLFARTPEQVHEADREAQVKLPPEPPVKKPFPGPERPEEKPPGRPTRVPEMNKKTAVQEKAEGIARRLVWPQYAAHMGWETGRPKKIIDGREQDDPDEMAWRLKLFKGDWRRFERWRDDRDQKLKQSGGTPEPIYGVDRRAGIIRVLKDTLLRQFSVFLNWMKAEKERQALRRQAEAMEAEWRRGGTDGRGFGDD